MNAWAHFDYDPQSLGVAGRFLSVRLENRGAEAAPIGRVRASFEAMREGVTFPCNEHQNGEFARTEPGLLPAGSSFVFERLLDCMMPLPGQYAVSVWLTGDGWRDAPGATGRRAFVGVLRVDVSSSASNTPRPIPARPGLFALIVGSPVSSPLTAEPGTRAVYRVALALVNGAPRPVHLDAVRLLVLLRRPDGEITCREREEVEAPSTLEPGAIYRARLPVGCAPAVEGQYEIQGRLSVAGGDEVDIGRVGMLVTARPYFLFIPDWIPLPRPPQEQPAY